MRVFINIGYPKTASTWFRSNFYTAVPDSKFIPPPFFLQTVQNYIKSEITVEDIHKKFCDKKSDLLFISDPELTGMIRFKFDENLSAEIAKAIKEIFPDATIILFLRNQIQHICSTYIYYIRKGGTLSISDLLNRIIGSKSGLTLDYLKYERMIQLYQDIFGVDNLKVYLYEDFAQNRIPFLENFCKENNFQIDLNSFNVSPRNAMLRKKLIPLLRFTNRFTKLEAPDKKYYFHIPYLYQIINDNFEKLNKLPFLGNRLNPEEILSKEQIQFLTDYYKNSNQYLISEFNLNDINKYGYPL